MIPSRMKEHCRPCQLCKRPAGAFRCQRCRSAFYCSVACQRKDWIKGGTHRKVCQALLELAQYQAATATMASLQLEQEYYMAMDMVERIHKIQSKPKQEKSRTTSPVGTPTPPTRSLSKPDNHSNQNHSDIAQLERTSLPFYQRIHYFGLDNWRFGMEVLPRLSCYHILIQLDFAPSQQFNPQIRTTLDDALQVQLFSDTHDDHAKLVLSIPRLPYPIREQAARIYRMDKNRYVSLSLPFNRTDADVDAVCLPDDLLLEDDFFCQNANTTIVDAVAKLIQGPSQLAAHISCAVCQAPLVPDPNAIRALAKAPSDRWDDLQDYISCGTQADASGLFGRDMQHRVDLILYDATSLTLSIAQTTNTCPLNIPKYGSTEVLDVSSESCPLALDVDSQAPYQEGTLTCLCCASTLGSATTSQQRFLLHRISVSGTTTRLSCISRYIAHVLIEQAESKAVYSLRVVCMDDENGLQQHHHSIRRSLVLRLVSWDSFTVVGGSITGTSLHKVAIALQTMTGDQGLVAHHSSPLDASTCRRTVKVLFDDSPTEAFHLDDESRKQTSYPDWTKWTRLDACCAPNNNNNNNNEATFIPSTAFLPCIGLDLDEFLSLKLELQAATMLIPNEVAQGAARAKLGPNADVSGVLLAAIIV